jgi:hypothetical protein
VTAWPGSQNGPGRSCRPISRACCPVERVFRGLDRWQASEVHRERLRALGLEGYRLHDARHHWAVRMARAGAPFELARQLGHRDVAMVAKVYGRFKPDTEERDRWERIASDRDAEKWGGKGAVRGAEPEGERENQREESPATPYEREASDDSRGGNRTRDPGIMSSDEPPEKTGSPSDDAP